MLPDTSDNILRARLGANNNVGVLLITSTMRSISASALDVAQFLYSQPIGSMI